MNQRKPFDRLYWNYCEKLMFPRWLLFLKITRLPVIINTCPGVNILKPCNTLTVWDVYSCHVPRVLPRVSEIS